MLNENHLPTGRGEITDFRAVDVARWLAANNELVSNRKMLLKPLPHFAACLSSSYFFVKQ